MESILFLRNIGIQTKKTLTKSFVLNLVYCAFETWTIEKSEQTKSVFTILNSAEVLNVINEK